MKRFKAFTLAEVMLAMTVIGVVAVLVIPTRFTGAQAKGYATLFKATFTQIQDSLTNAANIKKEPFIYVTADGSYDPALKLDKYMSKNFGAKEVEPWQPTSGIGLWYNTGSAGITTPLTKTDFMKMEKAYRLKNGVTLLFPHATLIIMNEKGCSNNTPCYVYIDVNGSKGPNHLTSCDTESETNKDITVPCTVSEDKINDIFAVQITKDHILPITNAINYILNR